MEEEIKCLFKASTFSLKCKAKCICLRQKRSRSKDVTIVNYIALLSEVLTFHKIVINRKNTQVLWQNIRNLLYSSKVCRTSAVLRVSTQIIRIKIQCWVDNKHLLMWHRPASTQRQARKLILGPSPTTKDQILFFNRTQSSVVIGLLPDLIPWAHIFP
jgi:hypothetical protein